MNKETIIVNMMSICLIITGIDSKGFLTFNQLGGWWDQSLLTQRVIIKNTADDKILGIQCNDRQMNQ